MTTRPRWGTSTGPEASPATPKPCLTDHGASQDVRVIADERERDRDTRADLAAATYGDAGADDAVGTNLGPRADLSASGPMTTPTRQAARRLPNALLLDRWLGAPCAEGARTQQRRHDDARRSAPRPIGKDERAGFRREVRKRGLL